MTTTALILPPSPSLVPGRLHAAVCPPVPATGASSARHCRNDSRRGVPSMTLSHSQPGQPTAQALLQQRNIGAIGEDAEAARSPRLGGFD